MSTTFGKIKEKVRKVTGRPSVNQISDTELSEYVNNFLIYEMPEQVRLFALRTKYEFLLAPNIGNYSLSPTVINLYTTFETPAHVDGFELQYFQDEHAFYQKFSQLKYSVQFGTGNGGAGPYNGLYTYTPIQPGSVVISTVNAAGASLTCTDNGLGTFTGNVLPGSTINYQTGAITGITWTAVIPVGTTIYISGLQYILGRPMAVLYFQDTFSFWPWPDRAYTFDIIAYQNPAQLTADPQVPELNEWWEFIAYGAALKIFADNLDMDSYGKTRLLFDEQRRLIERRTMKQLSTQRASTIYQDSQTWPWQGGYPYQ